MGIEKDKRKSAKLGIKKRIKKKDKALTGKYKAFDPRIQYKSEADKEAERRIWSTKSFDMALNAIESGLKLKSDPFFMNNKLLRKPELTFRRTKDEHKEWIKCKFDILYFAETYCQLMTNSGDYTNIVLREYQKKMLVAFATKDKVIVLSGRQIGKTTTTAIFLLWQTIFHKQRSVGLLGDKIATAVENLNKIKEILYRLPVWIKPGIVEWNVRSIKFDNKSKIFTGACNKSSLVGKTINYLYIDECAIPAPKLMAEVIQFAFPVVETFIKSGLGKIILTSTPNGDGPFKDIWMGAKYGTNSFFPVQVNWYLIPDRDINWRNQQIRDIGVDAFNEQFNCMFLSANDSLFNDLTIRKLNTNKKNFDIVEEGTFPYLDKIIHKVIRRSASTQTEPIKKFRIKRGYDVSEFKKPHIITVDIADGIMKDYTVFNIFRPIYRTDLMEQNEKLLEETIDDFEDDEFGWMADEPNYAAMGNAQNCSEYVDFEQVAVFHSNEHCIRSAALFLRMLFTKSFDKENSRIVIELNKYGGQFLDLMLTKAIYPKYEIDNESIGFYKTESSKKIEMGIMYNRVNKQLNVRQCKSDIESDRIAIIDDLTINECTTFGQNDNGTYSASEGSHDDIIMTVVTLSSWARPENNGFAVWVEEYVSMEVDDMMNEWDEDYYDTY